MRRVEIDTEPTKMCREEDRVFDLDVLGTQHRRKGTREVFKRKLWRNVLENGCAYKE